MSLSTEYFDRVYARSEDPWAIRERWYERRKRALTLASLPHARYASAFEPGCSIGELSAELATCCDSLLVSDGSEAAVRRARRRLRRYPHVRVEQQRVPNEWPEERFELVVLSELANNLDAHALHLLFERAVASLSPSGVLLMCHWRHRIRDCPLSGDEVHEAFGRSTALHRLSRHEEKDFLLEVWSPEPVSVAEEEHIVL